MGSNSSMHSLESYDVIQTNKPWQIISKQENREQKFMLKTYRTSSEEQHCSTIKYFKEYK